MGLQESKAMHLEWPAEFVDAEQTASLGRPGGYKPCLRIGFEQRLKIDLTG